MANRFTDPRSQFLDSAGAVYSGGFLYFYETGSTTPKDTYSDSVLTTPNDNPVELDSAGRLPNDVFLDPNVTYKVVLKDADGNTIWTADPVDDPAANVTAAFQVYAGNPNSNLAGSAGTPGGSGSSACWDITNNLLYVCTTTGTASTAVWTQVGATLAGGVQMTGIISPSSIGANQDDYSPTGNAAASIIRQDLSASCTLTGLADGAAGFLKTITNISSAYNLTLADDTISTASTATNRFKLGGYNVVLAPGQSIDLYYDNTSSRWRPKSATPVFAGIIPGGRLTLESGVPVSTSDQTAKTTVYYTPHMHGYVPLYNGTTWYIAAFSELSQALSNNTTSPAAAAVSSVYDLFVWNNAGTITLSRGPAWSSSTSRGTGAGTTELERINGRYTNKVAISNGPAANRGLYVGTIATDGNGANGQLSMVFAPAAASGGSTNRLDVWNMYNRVKLSSTCKDSADSWTYTTATWRAANNSAANCVKVVCGLQEDQYEAVAVNTAQSSANWNVGCGIGLDSTSAWTGLPGMQAAAVSTPENSTAFFTGHVGIGLHTLTRLEWSVAAGTTTWYGDNGAPTNYQSGITVRGKM